MLRVIFIFKRNNGFKIFLSDRIKISPELIQELHANLAMQYKDEPQTYSPP